MFTEKNSKVYKAAIMILHCLQSPGFACVVKMLQQTKVWL